MQRGAMLVAVVIVVMLAEEVWSHGMMLKPIQRSSMWQDPRFPSAPVNYNDNGLYCGGFERQWGRNNGTCGLCGDPADVENPDNEAGGKFATGVIVETYQQGDVIDVTVRITANHMGYFVFKLCPNNNPTQRITQQCLDQYVLKAEAANGGGLVDKFHIGTVKGDIHLRLHLPTDLSCTQCVLQWTYNTGNSWGCSGQGCCVGCGPQENFVNCADIAITPSSSTNPATTTPEPQDDNDSASIVPVDPESNESTSTISTTPMAATATTTTTATSTTTMTTAEPSVHPLSGGQCRAAGMYTDVPGMDDWCVIHCAAGFCPATHCTCP